MPVPPVSSLPEELTILPHWVAWREELRPGAKKRTKVPYVLATGQNASSTKPTDWCVFPEASTVPDAYSGLGFVFTKSAGFTGIDLDDCLIDGSIKPWAAEILQLLPSYAEISPSGNGIKIWTRAQLPGNGLKVFIDADGKRTVESMSDGSVEMYDTGRYFTVTGNLYSRTLDIPDLQTSVTALYTRLRGNERPEFFPNAPTHNFTIPTGPAVSEGGRHSFLLNQAAKWRARGMELPDLLSHLRDLNASRCSPPKPDFMLKGIAEWFADKVSTYRLTQRDISATHPRPQQSPAQKQVNGNSEPQPDFEDADDIPQSPIDRAEALLVAAIESNDPMEVLGVGTQPSALILALAEAGSIKQFEAKRRIKAAFKAIDVPRPELDARLKAAENALRPAFTLNEDNWEYRLIRKPNPNGLGAPAPCVTNALLYFENHTDWSGKLRWNEFTGEPVVSGDLPIGVTVGEQVKDHHDTLMQSWLERETQDYKWGIDTVRRSADAWAKAHSFNPVKEYLQALPAWDGVRRLNSWLFKYCGARPEAEPEDTPESLALSDFIAAIGERWWISAIARIFEPGCKVHHVLVLEGAKGIGKTTLAEIIFGEWYAVILGDVTSKDNQALMSAGVWGVLMDELDVLGKSEMRSIKSWVTRDFEKFRPTWGHRHEKRLRQCVFIATVNGSDWALEEDRRWWPVACRKAFDLDGLRRDRDILMAEALHRYRSKQRWYFHADEDAHLIATAKQEQFARVPEDTWHGLVTKAISKAKEFAPIQTIGTRIGFFVSKEDILDMLPQQHQNNRDVAANRVGRAMRSMPEWERIQITAVDKSRPWKYYFPRD